MEDLEFTISQYLDGTLPAADRLALEQELDANVNAREMLAEYRRLDSALKGMLPMPAIPWEQLKQSISAAVDEAHEAQTARTYRMPAWIRMSAMPLALAASLLIVAGVGIQIYNSHRSATGWPSPGTVAPVAATSSSTLVAFQTDQVSGPAEEEISIGPGTTPKNGPVVVSYAADAPAAPSHVTVVSGGMPVHDTQSAAYFDMQ